MKKKIIISALLIMILSIGAVSAATNWGKFEGFNIVKLVINGKEAKVQDVPAVMLNGRTMVPIYMLREAGLNVSWDGKKSTVSVKSTQSSNQNDSIALTKKVMSLGALGVTLMNIENELTALSLFESKKGFSSDWTSIIEVIKVLAEFNTAYITVDYYQNDMKLGYVDVKTSDVKDYISNKITKKQLETKIYFSGNLSLSANSNTTNNSTTINKTYPELYSYDLTEFLGKLTSNTYDADSVFNEYGTYGSLFSTSSIWNTYGDYGSEFSNSSAFNKYTTTPPVILHNDKIIGYVTVNNNLSNAVHPNKLKSYLEELGY